MSRDENIIPDLQACVLCEDVRAEMSGQQSLIGVVSVIPAPRMPIGFVKLCLWTRWCQGTGEFLQKSSILSADDDSPIASAEVKFNLQNLDAHATNVHVFGGVQFQKYGVYHIEVSIDEQIRLRIPLPVLKVNPPAQSA